MSSSDAARMAATSPTLRASLPASTVVDPSFKSDPTIDQSLSPFQPWYTSASTGCGFDCSRAFLVVLGIGFGLLTILSISASDKPLDPSILIFCSLPDSCPWPTRAGCRCFDIKRHLDLRHAALGGVESLQLDLPWCGCPVPICVRLQHLNFHRGRLSSASKHLRFLSAIVVLRGMRTVVTPPRVSMPN